MVKLDWCLGPSSGFSHAVAAQHDCPCALWWYMQAIVLEILGRLISGPLGGFLGCQVQQQCTRKISELLSSWAAGIAWVKAIAVVVKCWQWALWASLQASSGVWMQELIEVLAIGYVQFQFPRRSTQLSQVVDCAVEPLVPWIPYSVSVGMKPGGTGPGRLVLRPPKVKYLHQP